MGRNRWVRLFAAILFAVILVEPWGEAKAADPMDSGDFVAVSEEIPDVLQEIRYFSAYNFVGSHIDGSEEPVALMTREAVAALKDAAAEFRAAGYVIKIYDSYRPQRAVEHFSAARMAAGYLEKYEQVLAGESLNSVVPAIQGEARQLAWLD